MSASTTNIWCLIIDQKKSIVGGLFPVSFENGSDIGDLLRLVMRVNPVVFQGVDLARLLVLRPKTKPGDLLIANRKDLQTKVEGLW